MYPHVKKWRDEAGANPPLQEAEGQYLSEELYDTVRECPVSIWPEEPESAITTHFALSDDDEGGTCYRYTPEIGPGRFGPKRTEDQHSFRRGSGAIGGLVGQTRIYMVVIRCTQKLLRRVGGPFEEAPRSTTRLGDWYGKVVSVGHQRFALFISENCRLPVVLPARGLKKITTHLPDAVGDVLKGIGIAHGAIAGELEQMEDAVVAKTASRSLLGTLNEFGVALQWKADSDPQIDLTELALYLSETPVAPMDYDSPDRAVRRLIAE